MLQIVKTAKAERERLEQLLATQTASIRRAFSLFVTASTDEAALRNVRRMLANGDVTGAVAFVDAQFLTLANQLSLSFMNVATVEAAQWSKRLGVAVTYAANNRASQLMRENQLRFIRETGKEQRDAIRTALASGMRRGLHPLRMARDFKDSIGLTTFYLGELQRYADLLARGSAQALAHELRDKRFDDLLERVIDQNDVLTQAQIERMVAGKHKQLLAFRADNVARTEASRVLGMASAEAMQQTIEQTGIDPARIVKIWNTNLDGRERDSHHNADGQAVRYQAPFIVGGSRMMHPGDASLGAPIKERASCRCVPSYEILADADAVAARLKA